MSTSPSRQGKSLNDMQQHNIPYPSAYTYTVLDMSVKLITGADLIMSPGAHIIQLVLIPLQRLPVKMSQIIPLLTSVFK